MQRSIFASLTVVIFAVSGAGVSARETARDTDQAAYEVRMARHHEEQTRKETADQLRFERARQRARVRMQRERANERIGYSPLRPHTNTAAWSLGLGQR
ncbi:MAG TPA: hypothetical protein VGM05_26530 [Planctomycetaceae bacterium]|jgi:hypothetical protein